MDALTDFARSVYHLPDRLLHPLRRWRLERRLRAAPTPATVLFVCLGNICRSPYAERALERGATDTSWTPTVVSAGFVGPDRPSPEAARLVARDRGLDLTGHRSRRLTSELLAESDLIFVMDVVQRRAIRRKTGSDRVFLLGDLDPVWSGRRAIRDPVDQPQDVFRDVYERIDRTMARLTQIVLSGDA